LAIDDPLDLRGLMHRHIVGLLALEDSAGIGTQIIKRCIGHERISADVATLSRGLADKKLQEL
jgi:hypothetical protein